MKIKAYIYALCSCLLLSNAYADSVVQGAEEYDWQSCLNAKVQNCINDCTNSEDIHCNDNCNGIAKDKCLSEGLSPSQ